MRKLEEIKQQFSRGSKIEIILFEGTEHDYGYNPDGTKKEEGYQPGIEITTLSGETCIGYLASIDERRIHLATRWCKDRPANGTIYFDKDVIYSCNKIIQAP